MLHPRPNRERCDRDPPPDRLDAPIRSDEYTSRRDRAEDVLGGPRPDRGGAPVRRPVRPAERPARHPAPTERVRAPHPGRTAAGAP